MSIIEYFKDKILFLLINIMTFVIVASVMIVINISGVIVFLVFCTWFIPLIAYITIELIKHKRYFDSVELLLENLEKKYLLPEVMKQPKFLEGRIICDLLKKVSRDMHENVKYYRDMQEDYREYIEAWVHEIKTPIASTKLIIENNRDSVTDKINYQISKVETFVEQVLYYSRSNEVNKDYIIKSFDLNTAVMKVIKRNSRDFINKKIKLHIEDIEKIVYSDIKWVEFIINQIIVNSIKYAKDKDAFIKIYGNQGNNSITLTIEDNGVGIIDRDINKVFEKGFTGENGRIFGKATGMGLYLCKKLCKKLGLGINLQSKKDIGTTVTLIFPVSKL